MSRPEPFHWSQLESRDYLQYIANLRAIGCPEQTIHDIIRADVGQLYESRIHALESERAARWHDEYWKPRRAQDREAEIAWRARLRELDREREALVKELLGDPEAEREAGERVELAAGGPGRDPAQIPPDLEETLHGIQEKFHLSMEEIHERSRGRLYPDDWAKLKAIQDRRVEALSEVLSPEQLRQFELRESPTAQHLREQLAPFNPTREEFEAIFDARQAFDREYGAEHLEFDDPEFHQARERTEEQMDNQIRALLGEQRFADYRLSKDPRYRDLYQLGDRFDVPAESIDSMYDLWRVSEQWVDQIHDDPALSPEERTQILLSMRKEVESEARQTLGDAVFYNYRSRDGEWMRHLFGVDEPDR